MLALAALALVVGGRPVRFLPPPDRHDIPCLYLCKLSGAPVEEGWLAVTMPCTPSHAVGRCEDGSRHTLEGELEPERSDESLSRQRARESIIPRARSSASSMVDLVLG